MDLMTLIFFPVIGILLTGAGVLITWRAYQANGTTGFLKVSVEYKEGFWGIDSKMKQEHAKNPVAHLNWQLSASDGFHVKIKNTGRLTEEVLKIGCASLDSRERNEFQRNEFQSVGPAGTYEGIVFDHPIELEERLPFTVEPGHSKQLFLNLNWEEHDQLKQMKKMEMWVKTARGETVRVKVRK